MLVRIWYVCRCGLSGALKEVIFKQKPEGSEGASSE